jgi:L-asparaginase II
MAVKVGAMGLFCIAIPGRDMALAVKVHGGVAEALPALVAWALDTWAPGAWEEPEAWSQRVVRNVAGRAVGGWSVRV